MTENIEDKKGEKITVFIDPELKDLIPRYLENRHRDIKTIQESLGSGDYGTIQSLSHTMRGSGGGYGFDEITEIGKYMEQAAKDKSLEKIQRYLSELKTYLDCVEIIYE